MAVSKLISDLFKGEVSLPALADSLSLVSRK